MEKRLLYFLPLCFAVLLGWRLLADAVQPPRPPAPAPVVNPAADGAPAPTNASNAANPAGTGTPGATSESSTPVGEAARAKPEGQNQAAAPILGPVIQAPEARVTVLDVGRAGEAGYYRAVFSNQGGVLEELRTGNSFERAALSAAEKLDWKHWTILVSKRDTGSDATRSFSLRTASGSRDLEREPLDRALWEARTIEVDEKPAGIEFTLAQGAGVTFVKRFTFVPGTDQIRFELSIRNDARAEGLGKKSFLLTPATGMPNDSGDSFYAEPQAIAFSRATDGEDATPVVHAASGAGDPRSETLRVASPMSFAGLFNKYYAVLLRPADAASKETFLGASWRVLRDEGYARAHPDKSEHAWKEIQTDVDLQLVVPALGQTSSYAYVLYAGPKAKEAIAAAYPDHAVLIEHDLGFVSGIAKLLLFILNGFHALTSSWGLAIILLTISVRVLLFPINRRSQTAMGRYQSKMKRIQPRIEEIKKRYEKDPAKARQEQAKIMQEEGAFPPLGGCLPPLLQIPVFIGLFRAIGVSFDLRQASFLGWIHDLSLPDQLIRVDWHIPVLGAMPYINVLPPLMVIMWILQQRSMPMPTEEQARTMYKMMMWMPVVMGIFLYNYAAGLSVYMITQSTLGIVEQKVIRKYWPIDDTEIQKPKKKGGFMQKLLEAQEQKMKQIEAKKRAAKKPDRARR